MVHLLTRAANVEGTGELTIRDLFRNCLRMRPSRIILGEIRGREALDFLQALNSGHRGSLAVIHASSPEEAVIRLENLVHYGGLQVPVAVIRSQVAHGLDLVVQLTQLSDGTRKLTRISEIAGLDKEGRVALRDVYYFREMGLTRDGRVQGRFLATGIVPLCFERFRLAGIPISDSIFRG